MSATIVFVGCKDKDSEAACCIAYLAQYFGIDDSTMTNICKLAEAVVPSPDLRCQQCDSGELTLVLGKIACSKCGAKRELIEEKI